MIVSFFRCCLAMAVLIFAIYFTLGCMAATAPVSRMTFEEQHQFVRLEVTIRANQHNHSHPALIPETTFSNILSSLTVNPRPASPLEMSFAYKAVPLLPRSSPAFSPDAIAFLSKQLSHALQLATPLEEALFLIEDPQPQGTVLLTSGGCYIQGGRLHFQIANFRHPTIGKTEVAQARANPLEVLSHSEYDLIPGPYGKVQPRPVWKNLITALPQLVIFDYEHTLQEPATPIPLGVPLVGSHHSPYQTLAEQLRELQQVKEDGLISREEYEIFRQKLLDTF